MVSLSLNVNIMMLTGIPANFQAKNIRKTGSLGQKKELYKIFRSVGDL